MVGIETVEVLCGASDRFSQRCHQFCLFNVFGLQCLSLILSEQERAQCGLPAQTLSPNNLKEEVGKKEEDDNILQYKLKLP